MLIYLYMRSTPELLLSEPRMLQRMLFKLNTGLCWSNLMSHGLKLQGTFNLTVATCFVFVILISKRNLPDRCHIIRAGHFAGVKIVLHLCFWTWQCEFLSWWWNTRSEAANNCWLLLWWENSSKDYKYWIVWIWLSNINWIKFY